MSESTPPPDGAAPGPAGDAPEAPGAAAAHGGPPDAVRVRMRRAPRYRAFVVSGAVAGVLLGVLVAMLVQPAPGVEEFSRGTVVRYFAAIVGLVGAVVGAGLAVLVERRR